MTAMMNHILCQNFLSISSGYLHVNVVSDWFFKHNKARLKPATPNLHMILVLLLPPTAPSPLHSYTLIFRAHSLSGP